MEWPDVLESSREFDKSPPLHILVRDFVGYKAPSDGKEIDAAEKRLLTRMKIVDNDGRKRVNYPRVTKRA